MLVRRAMQFVLISFASFVDGQSSPPGLQACGEAYYSPSKYTCYDTNFLCPVLDSVPTLRCGSDCYLPSMYSCENDHLVYPPVLSIVSSSTCPAEPTSLHLSSPPYENYFLSDCNSATQVVITSPQPSSNLTIIGPRIIVAWASGNSGIAAFFSPANGINGTLGIRLLNSTTGSPLGGIFEPRSGKNATVGITTLLELNSSAILSRAILGSVRTMRDFIEGPSLLYPEIQDAVRYKLINGGVEITRLWLDNQTTISLSFSNVSGQAIQLSNSTVTFSAGSYVLNASYDYPQLIQLSTNEVLNSASHGLITESQTQAQSLSFLSYTDKLTAGAWRFLTYFGRDSMIATLLLEPVLSEGKGGATEAVIAAVLERVNATDGSACHEETIGDYATWLNLKNNITSTAPLCDYKMIDTDYYLPILASRYFVSSAVGQARASEFLSTTATTLGETSNLTYEQLLRITSNKIINLATPFAAQGNQTVDNLMHLKDGEIVGEWRDSTYGIGGGRIPFEVNTALVPAALRAIAELSRAGILSGFDADTIDVVAGVWEENTVELFEVSLPISTARSRISAYAASFSPPLNPQTVLLNEGDGDVTFYALALQGNNNLSRVEVMNTDSCFRLFLLNTTHQGQLTKFLNNTANHVKRKFPAGLMTDVGMLVANPAFGDGSVYARNWTNSAYHGTVVWSWQLAMMARGIEIQLSRCNPSPTSNVSSSPASIPEFCAMPSVHTNILSAYNILWDTIEANQAHLSTEVWSWVYDAKGNNGTGRFQYIDLGELPPPPGVGSTESDIVQLWSLTFLAVRRNEGLK